MAEQPNKAVYKVVVAVWLTLSLASVVLAAITWMELSNKLAAAREASATHSSSERVLRLMVDCETGARGFILTGQEGFLQPFVAGETSLTSEMDRLVELTRHDSHLLKRVIDLRAEIDVALNRLHMIVGNAVKFTDRGNIYIRVNWEEHDTRSHITLMLEVQDTGVGIPGEKLEAIFKPFVQAGTHHDKEKGGTGLGLAIVRRLAELQGGSCGYEPSSEGGSRFFFTLPEDREVPLVPSPDGHA